MLELPKSLLAPKHWPSWCLVGLLWLLSQLPRRAQYWLGRLIGQGMRRYAKKMLAVTRVNIDLCFPDLPAEQKQALINECFANAGIATLETARAWWHPDRRITDPCHVHGLEYIERAVAEGQSVLLLGCHQTTLQIIGRLLHRYLNVGVVYRQQHNPVFNWIVEGKLQQHYQTMIPSHRLLGLKTALRRKQVIWYTPDIDPRDQASLFAPFFGKLAATVTIPGYFAKKLNTVLIPMGYRRDDTTLNYHIHFLPPLPITKDSSDLDIATRVNEALEGLIRLQPAQYLWQYKRFKTQPKGQANPYKPPS